MNYEERGKLNEELYPLVVAGDQDAKRRMIEGNMGLVEKKVQQYLAKHPHLEYLRDDLISEGWLSLCKAVDNLANGTKAEKPLGYLSAAIKNGIVNASTKELGHGLGACERTVKSRHSNGIDMPGVRSLTAADNDAFTAPKDNALEVLEAIYACCHTEQERQIIELRSEGWTDAEVSQALDVPRATVRVIRKRIEERYDRSSVA